MNHDGSSTLLPASNPDFTEQQTDHGQGQGIVDLQDQSPYVDPVIMPQNAGLDLDFLSTSNWTDKSLEHVASGPCDLPDHDISYPDTSTFDITLMERKSVDARSNIFQCHSSDFELLQLALW